MKSDLKLKARELRTLFSHQLSGGGDDPLNRIQWRAYDISGPLDATVHAAPAITYEYETAGDKSRIKKITTAGLLYEDYSYDVEGRVSVYEQKIIGRETKPLTTSYLYDTLDRVTEVTYPAQWGLAGNPRKIVAHSYDSASRLTSLTVGGTVQASDVVYNAADQTTQIKIGPSGANQVTEDYTFDPQTGLLTNQKAIKNGSTTLLDLSYEYNRLGSVGSLSGKTGHLTRIIDNLNNNKNREYEFDALGRLTKAKGGPTGNLSSQTYTYDRYGNRTSVTATGVAADNSTMPSDGIPNLAYDTANNRITTTGFEYDVAGNQTRALAADGVTWRRYEYDAANRLHIVKEDNGTTFVQAFQFGSTNARLMDTDYATGFTRMFASVGGTVLAEYRENYATPLEWTKSYIYLGDSQLSTILKDGGGGEYTEYNHPDRLGTRVITNQTLGSSYEQAHLPFGTALNAETTGTTNKRFTTYDRSAPTGLDYAINRTYDSKQGRFTQVDPIGMQSVSLTAPQTLNLYAYCVGDPVNYTDPSGLFLGRFFRWLINLFRSRVARRIAIKFVVSFIVSGGNFGVAIRSVAPDILRQLGLNPDPLLTPSWNPNIRHPLTAGVGSLSRYIITNFSDESDRIARSALDNIFRVLTNMKWLIDIIIQNKRGRYRASVAICHAAVESSLDPNAVGQQGEIGLFQVKPATAKPLAPLFEPGPLSEAQLRNKLRDPAFNTKIGTQYLDNLSTKFGGNLRTALGAYKQGETSVVKNGLTQASQDYADGIDKCANTLIGR